MLEWDAINRQWLGTALKQPHAKPQHSRFRSRRTSHETGGVSRCRR